MKLLFLLIHVENLMVAKNHQRHQLVSGCSTVKCADLERKTFSRPVIMMMMKMLIRLIGAVIDANDIICVDNDDNSDGLDSTLYL